VLERGGLVCASARALAEGVPPAARRAEPIELQPGLEPGVEGLAESLALAGYERVERVDDRGQFAVRGGIVDVFPTTGREPLRIEFWGDEIEQMRAFSPFTQRALHPVESAVIYPAAERRLDPAEEVLRPQCLAAMREGDDDALPRAKERCELALGLGQAAGGDRGALRLERVRLGLRERVELRRASEGRRSEDAVLLPDATDIVRLEDEIGWPPERRHEIVWHLGGGLFALVVRELRLEEIEPPLRRRIQRRLGDRVERALRERREGAHRLDLVAEELDA